MDGVMAYCGSMHGGKILNTFTNLICFLASEDDIVFSFPSPVQGLGTCIYWLIDLQVVFLGKRWVVKPPSSQYARPKIDP